MSAFSHLDDVTPATREGFADGWTAFETEAGLDVLLRTSDGESKGRLGELDADGNLVGTIYAPGAGEKDAPMALIAKPIAKDAYLLSCGKRQWMLRQPKGKSHYFAFLNQWPAKAEATTRDAMFARLKKKP
jgi:hypothetical protein